MCTTCIIHERSAVPSVRMRIGLGCHSRAIDRARPWHMSKYAHACRRHQRGVALAIARHSTKSQPRSEQRQFTKSPQYRSEIAAIY